MPLASTLVKIADLDIWDRFDGWYERIVLQTFDDEQWIQNFRMIREMFENITISKA